MPSLHVEVRDDEIIVTQSGSKFRIVYRKAKGQPQLIANGTPHGNYDFLAQAWQAANDKARGQLTRAFTRECQQLIWLSRNEGADWRWAGRGNNISQE
jgi:hypothetical protein